MPQSVQKPEAAKSLDYGLFMAFHACMMVMLLLQLAFGVGIHFQIPFTAGTAIVLVTLSVRNRRRMHWHWPGAKLKDVLAALGSAALVVFFFGAILPGHSVLNPRIFPWLAFGANFLVYIVLITLKVVAETNAEFLSNCGDNRIPPPQSPPAVLDQPRLRGWRYVVFKIFTVLFMAVWIMGVAFFWKWNSTYGHGSPQPTATQTQKLTSHGHAVYITPEEERSLNLFEHVFAIGMPSVLVLGVVVGLVTRSNAKT